MDGYISKVLEDAMKETLNSGRQVMLFINRRGHSPIVQCKKCGWVAACPDCSCGFSYHKKSGVLLCHICGRVADMPKVCPTCFEETTLMGAGIEKIEEEVRRKFPNARTALVSSDTMNAVGALEKLISQIENNQVDVIIGTQILAKGHHFPNLTLVGVIDSDMGLYGTDFRAAERTFQQLFQVAGRAGRGAEKGRVILQTFQPDHPVMRALADSDRDEFVRVDMENRRAAKMPPYGQLIALVIDSEKEDVLIDFCGRLRDAAPVIRGGRIFGPIPAELYQVRNRYRMRFLVSGEEGAALQPVVRGWLCKVKQPASVRLKIDVNPQSFL
jgi:primosomal protein N' (replication factor Y)